MGQPADMTSAAPDPGKYADGARSGQADSAPDGSMRTRAREQARSRAERATASHGPSIVPVVLSTASVFPERTADAFELAARLGYDGVEVMVTADPVSPGGGRAPAVQVAA